MNNIAILCQEESIYLGPFIRKVIESRPESISAIFIAGRRSAGEKNKSILLALQNLYVYWLILEPSNFFKVLLIKLRAKTLKNHDVTSIESQAMMFNIPVYHIDNPNDENFIKMLKNLSPDIVLNQSECLLGKKVLSIPRIGFINRHASLLPHFRGRLGSFWSHQAESPEYGLTIHYVDEGVDTGAIILQRQYDLNPRSNYHEVMCTLFSEAHHCLWEAIDLLNNPAFTPSENNPVDEAYKFPTINDAKLYQERLRLRRLKK